MISLATRWSVERFPFTEVTEKHMYGQHDQSTHGHGGATVGSAGTYITSEYGDRIPLMRVDSPSGNESTHNDYEMQHQAASNNGFSANILNLEEHMPDVLDPSKGPRFYGTNSVSDKESFESLYSLTGDPNQKVTIYRGVPNTVSSINNGDWVTLSPSYAAGHVASSLNGEGHVLATEVPASALWSDGDSINEFGLDFSSEVHKHLAGQHDQSSHGHPSIGAIPSSPTFKNTGYNDLESLKPKDPAVWESINWYVNGGSSLINGSLRGEKVSPSYLDEMELHKKVFEDAIAANTATEDFTVHRWLTPEGFGMESSELESLIGKTYSDKGFMSTATMLDKNGDSTFSNWANGSSYSVHMNISVPKGTHAMRINPMESEILFPPNTPMYIHDVRVVDNYIQIDASVVNDASTR